jgi:hypothetical protein
LAKAEYARHRGVSQPYISKLAKNGVLVMRGNKVAFRASDMVLDDKPIDNLEPAAAPARMPSRPAPDASPGRAGTTFSEAGRAGAGR